MTSSSHDRAIDLFCPECSYNLRGLTGNVCPECGQAFDPETLCVSRIPWVHRTAIGWFRAYWRTVRLAVFQPGRLGEEVARPVSYRDAQRFRWLTVLHACLAVLVACSYAFIRAVARSEYQFGSAGFEAGVGFKVEYTPRPSR